MLGSGAVVCLYALLSFLALREFLTITPTHRRDHRALTWAFFIILPLHYLLTFVHWYPMFLIFIPVYAFVFFPIRLVMAGEVEDFLSRTARLQWGLLVCVYFLSYIPWLMQMEFPKAENGDALHASGLLLWMIIVTQGNDVFQFAWGKALGERPLSPKVSPNKTWEGFIGGCLTAVLLGVATSFATPFGFLGGALMALMLCLLGTAGGLVMSAIKRDFKSKDWGGGIPGHGGILDRVDSLIFSAPPFFHLTSYYFGGVIPATDTHVVNLLRFWQ
jgi:phosphatidate cytidylyltransferase